MGGLQRRKQSKSNAGSRPNGESKREDSPIKIKSDPKRHFVGKCGQHQVHAPDSQKQPKRAAGQSNHETFGKKLTHDLVSASTQREANSNLLYPSSTTREEEVGDIRAGDK